MSFESLTQHHTTSRGGYTLQLKKNEKQSKVDMVKVSCFKSMSRLCSLFAEYFDYKSSDETKTVLRSIKAIYSLNETCSEVPYSRMKTWNRYQIYCLRTKGDHQHKPMSINQLSWILTVYFIPIKSDQGKNGTYLLILFYVTVV